MNQVPEMERFAFYVIFTNINIAKQFIMFPELINNHEGRKSAHVPASP